MATRVLVWPGLLAAHVPELSGWREWGGDNTEQRIALEPFCYCYMCTPVPVLNTRNLLQSRASPASVPWMLRVSVTRVSGAVCGRHLQQRRTTAQLAVRKRPSLLACLGTESAALWQRSGSALAGLCSALVTSSAASSVSRSFQRFPLFRCAGLAGGTGADGVVGHVVVEQVLQQRLGSSRWTACCKSASCRPA